MKEHQPAQPILASPIGPSPVSKFDYVTRLVSHHDQAITRQNVLISELVQRIGALEEHAKQSSSQNAVLVQQNVQLCQELATVKKGMEKAHKAQSKQEDKERRALEEKVAASDTRMLQTGLLQADVDKLKKQVEELQKGIKSLVASHATGLKASIEHQIQAAASELQKKISAAHSQNATIMASLRGEVEQDVSCIRAECSAAASSVEASAMAANSLAMKLRNHVQACNTAEAAASAKLGSLEKAVAGLTEGMHRSLESMTEPLSRTVDGLSSTVAHLNEDSKRIKKHVVKLEQIAEGLQSLGNVAVAADKALQEVKRDCDQTAASMVVVRTQSEEASNIVRSMLTRILEVEAQMASASELSASNRIDLGNMAESLGAAFQQFHESTRKGLQHQAQQYQQLALYVQQVQQHIQQPTSYLQSLLGPGTLSSTSAMSMARMQLLGGQQTAQQVAVPLPPAMPQGEKPAWESGPTEFDTFLRQFRAKSHNGSTRAYAHSNGQMNHRQS